jgi:very-short-patch-repair endonuclease
LGSYILDFVCFEHRLIVEIDGPSHDVLEQRLADEVRDDRIRYAMTN